MLQTQRVAKNVVAMNSINSGLAHPTLAAHFTGNDLLTRGNGSGKFGTQVKIPADAFTVGTIEPEDRPGIVKIDRVLDLTVPGDTFRREEIEFDRQRFQLREFVREADGLFDALIFQLPVIGAGTEFLMTHNFSILLSNEHRL